jgi:chromosome segregation ATPase
MEKGETGTMIQWDEEKNLRLIEIVTSGKDTKDGLQKAAAELGTTYYAVRNRWYSQKMKELRGENTETELKDTKTEIEVEHSLESEKTKVSLEMAMKLLNEAIEDQAHKLRIEIEQLKATNNELTQNYEKLQKEYDTLKENYDSLKEKYSSLQEEYSIFHRIITKAREIVVAENIGERPEPKTFKMEKNGNLEPLEPLAESV